MASLGNNYTMADMPEDSGDNFAPLPAGYYDADITKAELRDTKKGDGQYVSIRFDITGPTHQGRVVFANLNIRNPNQVAERIGVQQLLQVAQAIGIDEVSDTDQLIGGSLSIKVDIEDSEKYGEKNVVKGYKSNGNKVSKPDDNKASSSSAPPWASR